MKLKTLLLLTISVCYGYAFSQATYRQQPLDYRSYMEHVQKQNLGYAAEQLNVDIAEAELKAAHIFNDVSLGIEYADNDERVKQMGRSVTVELSKTFSPGRRSPNIDLARSEKALNEALLEDYFHMLRAEATKAYLNALARYEICLIREDAYNNIQRLAESDSIRFVLGEITQVNATQSKLEAGMMFNELIQARVELHNAYTSLSVWTGEPEHRILYTPSDRLQSAERIFDIDQLIRTALDNRADLAAALKNVDVAGKALKVAKRERNMEFDVALGYNYNTKVRNEIAPAPQFNGVTLGVAFPLKISNLNKGAVKAAQYRVRQAEINHRQAELEIRNSVRQSFSQFDAMREQMANYNKGMLQQAKTVIDGKIYSYQRGETSLLEALDAQRTYDELRSNYFETLYNYLIALVELERNAGIWDLDFTNTPR